MITVLIPAWDWRAIDRRYDLPDDAKLRWLADRMDEAKRPGSGRPEITPGSRSIGLFGERAFARHFGLPMDTEIRPDGSKRKNFVLNGGTTVDVVTRRPLRHGQRPDLLVPQNTPARVDVWVLVEWLGLNFEAILHGWQFEHVIRERNDIRVMNQERGVPNFFYPADLLEPMWLLFARHDSEHPEAQEPETITVAARRPQTAQLSLL